jgi:hypothetical protein
MDVGMFIECLAPGVKDGGESDASLKSSLRNLLQSFRHRFKKDFKTDFLIGPGEPVEFVGHCENYVKIPHRQEFGLSCFNPPHLG